ncbi:MULTISPECIES: bacteriocin immunity protein [Streptomyces]|uniref:bacteriocin immunity protein n=1 Tax=unclassified Streptomyces TaxID=2593676 RepID=UPI000B17BB65|nr:MULTISPECIES: bacteriocin immunity protein [unclassified Streptomyces]
MRGDASAGTNGRMSRGEALSLVRRLLNDPGDTSEAEADEILDALERGLACPHISDYIYWPPPSFEPTPEEIVERALAYRPTAL